MKVVSERKAEARTSRRGAMLENSYAGGGLFLILGQDVFNSIAINDDASVEWLPPNISLLSEPRKSWIVCNIDDSSSGADAVILMMMGFVGKLPDESGVVNRVRTHSIYDERG